MTPAPVIDLIEAFRRSQAMFTAVSLGVFDVLAESPASAAETAAKLSAHAGAMEQLLNACAAMGFLEKRDGVFRNAPVAERYLCTASPDSLRGYVMYSHQALYPMWAHLDDAVREGGHRWRQTFGLDGAIFSHFFRTPEAMHDFLMGMHGFGMLTSPAVVAAFDLSRFRKLADLGGATGHLAMAACARYPDMRAIVWELPSVVAGTKPSERLQFVPGDFFADELPAADIYALGQVLHDWDDAKIATLLSKIYRALPAGGGLLIAERLLNDDGVGPVPANMQSLNMLICTEGRERSAAEYEALLRAAGFSQVSAKRTGTPRDAILALKAQG
jgi:acetylserotonin N-methyltransferase